MEQHDWDEYQTLFEIHAPVHSSIATKALRSRLLGAVVASSPLQPIHEKHRCQIARFIDAPCICDRIGDEKQDVVVSYTL
jgi:hypothetical protein